MTLLVIDMNRSMGTEVSRRENTLRRKNAAYPKSMKAPIAPMGGTSEGLRKPTKSHPAALKKLSRNAKDVCHSFGTVGGARNRTFASLRSNATALSLGTPSSTALQENAKALQHAPERSVVVVIDNYDSFTYNLCQYMGDLGCQYVVFKNDELSVEEIRALQPRGVLVSPGPGTPDDSGIALEAVRELGPEIPLFGVCMGHQCIGQVFGGEIVRAPCGLMHGKTSPVYHNDSWGILKGMDNPFTAARYHSLVISQESFPENELEITAWTEDRTVMACRHKVYRHIQGVQFHPESIITENGLQIIRNWMNNMDEFYKDK